METWGEGCLGPAEGVVGVVEVPEERCPKKQQVNMTEPTMSVGSSMGELLSGNNVPAYYY